MIECFPVEGTVFGAGEQIVVECNVVFLEDALIGLVALAFPCWLLEGTPEMVNLVDLFIDTAHTNPPFLFGPDTEIALTDISELMCGFARAWAGPSGEVQQFFQGEVLYFTTVVYEASLEAEGEFLFSLNCSNYYPAGCNELCVGKDEDFFVVGFDFAPWMVTVIADPGSRCLNGSCLADGVSEAKCEDLVAGGPATFVSVYRLFL